MKTEWIKNTGKRLAFLFFLIDLYLYLPLPSKLRRNSFFYYSIRKERN